MMRRLSVIIFTCLLGVSISAQTGRVAGIILDSKTGEPLVGAAAQIEGTAKGGLADLDGKFSINNVPVGKVNIVVSFVSYTSKKVTDVVVKAGEETNVNVKLEPASSTELGPVEIVVKIDKGGDPALVLKQKENASVSDGISAETIRKTPDRNTADVLKRITGVTIQDDKFVIVRGLNERYNASYLNGAPLPSTEPDKRAFSFDLFPANMLDNIEVFKTARPDLPGEFAGGIVFVNTRSIPEKNFVSFQYGNGYNTVTTGKAKTVYDGGKWDKFGFDDGSRNLPAQVPAFADKASWIANSDQARVAGYFKNDWGFSQSKFAPNTSAQFATGYNIKLKERDFIGILFSLSYNSTQSLYTLLRREPDIISVTGDNITPPQLDQKSINTVNQTQNSTGALLNLSCKINSNNSVSVKNLATGYSDNRFISSINTFTIGAPGNINKINSRYFTANQILSTQFNGDHFIPAAKIRVDWNASYSQIKRTVPNMRSLSYSKWDQIQDPSDPWYKDTMWRADVSSTAGPNYAGYRIFSALDENIKSGKVDVSRNFKIGINWSVDVKAGFFGQFRERLFNIRQFGIDKYQYMPQGIYFADSLLYLPENQIFATQNMSVTPDHYGGFKTMEITKYEDNYHAMAYLYARYAMAEVKYSDKLRLIGGLRYESYSQKVIVKERLFDSVFVNNTVNDLLPSVNLVYNINEKIGLRLAWYKTLNRAEFRELATISWYDPETRLSLAGNAGLQRAVIKNYDARFEIYPGRGQLFTTTGFYKYFDHPIEKYMMPGQENQIFYRNANFGHVYGAELEYRINLGAVLKTDSIKFLNNLNLFSNLALMKSQVNVAGLNSHVPDTREMQGQAPYIINTGISYIDNDHGFSFTAMLNRVGERIYLVGNDIDPNRWENPRTVIDLQATKSFFKNRLEIRFNIKDLLHQDWILYYKGTNRVSNKYQKDVDFLNFQRNFGTVYSFLITYKF